MPRILFEKTGPAVYISHLDLMRVFQRSFRRGGILIRHSQGYSPKAHVSIALPMSVGVESVCELLDFDLAEGVDIPLQEIPQRLNRTMPAGIRAIEIWESGRKLKELTHLDVQICLEYDEGVPSGAAETISSFFSQGNPILVSKRTKNGMVEQDIAPMIARLETSLLSSHELSLKARICAQNPSLNPALIGSAICKYLPEIHPDFITIKRLEILDQSGSPFR